MVYFISASPVGNNKYKVAVKQAGMTFFNIQFKGAL